MTSVLNFCIFQCPFHFLYGFRTLSSREGYGFVEREGSASNSLYLALAMAMAAFQFPMFFGPFSDLLLSGLKGLLLHVRCTPQQNSQWQFWASVCVCVYVMYMHRFVYAFVTPCELLGGNLPTPKHNRKLSWLRPHEARGDRMEEFDLWAPWISW